MPTSRDPAPVSTVGDARGAAAVGARCGLRLVATLVLTLAGGSALALGLGDVARQSTLGSPLSVVVPITLGPGEELAADCVRIANSTRRGDGLPEVSTARIVLESSATGTHAVVSSDRPVTEPVLRLALQVGCEGSTRREYVLLFDPPAIEIPVGEAPEPVRASPQRADTAGAAAPANAAAPAPATKNAPKRRPAAGGSPRGGGRGAQGAGRASKGQGRSPPPAKAPAGSRAPKPRLSVSAGAPGESARTGPAGPGAGASASSASAALESEAAALQNRVAELTALVDKMQADLRAAEAPRPAPPPPAAAPAAPPAPQPTNDGTAWYESWAVIAGAVGIVALLTAWLLVRVRRAGAARHAGPPLAMHDTPSAVPPSPSMPPVAPSGNALAGAEPVPAAPAMREAVIPEIAVPRLRPPNETVAIDVEELSQVTEEAGVYLHFNRPDAAIKVLRDHIARTTKSLPAAWLMLLDLYHRQNQERDFRDLAEAFHSHFNVRAPDWAGYGEQPEGDAGGLENYPHLVREVTARWGKPECRRFLEELLYDRRDGQRTGFSLETYEDIVFLLHLLEVRH